MRCANACALGMYVLVSLGFLACGGGSDDGDDGDAGAGADAGGLGDASTGGRCEPPAGAEVVIPWTRFEVNPDGDSPAYGLATDGTNLFVTFFELIVSVPLEGGSVTEVYRSSEEIPFGFLSWQDEDGIVVRETDVWVRIPYAGGAPEPLSVDFPQFGTVIDWDSASDTFIVVSTDFETDLTRVDSVKINGARTPLVESTTFGENRRWAWGGSYLYTQGAAPFDGEADDGFYRFAPPSYDTPELLAVSPPVTLIVGADDGSVYYTSGEDPTSWGLYRVAHGDSAAEQVYSGYWIGSLLGVWGTQTEYVNDANYLWRVPPTGAARQIAPVPTEGCTTHEVLAHDGWVYTATYASLEGENLVWRIRE